MAQLNIGRSFRKLAATVSLALIDLSCLILVFYLSHKTSILVKHISYNKFHQLFIGGSTLSLWWVPVIFISFICYENLYTRRLPLWDGIKLIIKAITSSTVLSFAIIAMINNKNYYPHFTIALMYIYSIILLPFFRIVGKNLLFNLNIWKERIIIIGAGQAGRATAKGILENSHLGYEIIGFLDDDNEKIGKYIDIDANSMRYKVLGRTRHYRRIIKTMDVSTVVVAMPSLSTEKLSRITNDVQKHAKHILLVPDLKGISLANTELYHLFNQKLFIVNIKNNLKSWLNNLFKSLFDYILSFLLIPILFPIIAILGLLIKLDSPGPIFFSHTRVGKNGKPIQVYKFRTMFRDSKERLENILASDPTAREEWETYYKLKNDPRITKIGNFLRKSSLDELPQIFNVLKNEMSLVGPRPVIRDEIVKYYKADKEFYFLTKPGITGLWQVSGRNEIDYEDRVKLDTWYVLNWSIWFDIVILLKTIKVVLARQGAY